MARAQCSVDEAGGPAGRRSSDLLAGWCGRSLVAVLGGGADDGAYRRDGGLAGIAQQEVGGAGGLGIQRGEHGEGAPGDLAGGLWALAA